MACGFKPDILIFGTEESAVFKSSNGMIRDATTFGAGIIFKVSSVMIPRVPSEPIIKFNREYPEEVLDTVAPRWVISPVGRTTVMART